jgi:hypothetical protein
VAITPQEIYGGHRMKSATRAREPTRFAVFPDDASGELALRKLSSENYASNSIDQAIAKYAPAFEINTRGISEGTTRKGPRSGATRIDELTNLQVNALLDTIRGQEQWRVGTVTTR